MKIQKLLTILFALFLVPVLVLAQSVDTTGVSTTTVFSDPTLSKMLTSYEAVYGALVIVWGYIAKALKFNKMVSNFVFVVAGGGIILGGVFLIAGWAKAVPLVFSFLSAIGIFDVIFKPASKLITQLPLKKDLIQR